MQVECSILDSLVRIIKNFPVSTRNFAAIFKVDAAERSGNVPPTVWYRFLHRPLSLNEILLTVSRDLLSMEEEWCKSL